MGTFVSRLNNDWTSLYTFLRIEEVEGTNNHVGKMSSSCGSQAVRQPLAPHQILGCAGQTYPNLLVDL